jgi:tetratricopeptide (TPR) repeat protein
MNYRNIHSGFLFFVALSLLSLNGCQNNNLFGRFHDRGDSSSIVSLRSDASSALKDGNYSQALELYNRILSQDPNNAEAIYGAAAAEMGTSGLKLSQIIANVLQNQNGAGASSMGLGQLVRSAGGGVHSSTVDPNSLLNGIDLASLDGVIDNVICKLERITSGSTDLSIPANDIDTLVNLAVVLVLRAALDAQQAGLVDITNVNGTWSYAQGANYSSFCGNSANDSALISMATDLSGAYACLNRVVSLLNLSGNQVVVQLKTDVDAIITELLTSGLPAGCRTTLDTNGINSSTFQSYFNLSTPPSGC